MSDLRELAEAAAVCTDAELAAVYAALPHPLPPVRHLDELREPELDPKSPHTAGGFAAAMGIGLVAFALPFLN